MKYFLGQFGPFCFCLSLLAHGTSSSNNRCWSFFSWDFEFVVWNPLQTCALKDPWNFSHQQGRWDITNTSPYRLYLVLSLTVSFHLILFRVMSFFSRKVEGKCNKLQFLLETLGALDLLPNMPETSSEAPTSSKRNKHFFLFLFFFTGCGYEPWAIICMSTSSPPQMRNAIPVSAWNTTVLLNPGTRNNLEIT